MSIKLDWEVESEGGWSEIGEDEAARLARQRQASRARRIAIGVAAAGLLIGIIVGLRLYATDQQNRADLRATVAAETAALRIGDHNAYLNIQQKVGNWQGIQDSTFTEHQAQTTSGHLKANGEIVHLDVDGTKGRVVVRETLDGKPYNVTWFYQRGDDGWKHVPPEIAFWGWLRENKTNHFDISYWDEDATFAETLASKLKDWWDIACRQTECNTSGPPPIVIRIEPDPLVKLGWADYDPNTLRVPSPLLGRVPADGSIDPALEKALAGYFAQHWTRFLLGDHTGEYSDVAWLADELQQHLAAKFGSGQQPAPLVGPLVEHYGSDALVALIARIKQNEEAVSALQAVTGVNPADLPVTWDDYLLYRLRGEVALAKAGHPTEAAVLYDDPERAGSGPLLDRSPIRNIEPRQISVISTRRVGDLTWAEVHFVKPTPKGGDVILETYLSYEPFRLFNNRWVHSAALADSYGERKEETSPHITLTYNEIDIPSVEGLLGDLEQQFSTLDGDLGGSGSETAQVSILPGITNDSTLTTTFPPERGSPQSVTVFLGSPYTNVYMITPSLHERLRALITRDMVMQMVTSRVQPLTPRSPLALAIARSEMSQLGLDPDLIDIPVGMVGLGPPASLESVWAVSTTMSATDKDYIAAQVLIDLLVEIKGRQALAPLMQNISNSTSMDDWLNRSLGLHAADLEPEWKTRVLVAVTGTR